MSARMGLASDLVLADIVKQLRQEWPFAGDDVRCSGLPFPRTKAVRLEGDAAFSAAVAAGVPVTSEFQDGKLVMKLAHPVEVWVDGGVCKVFTREAP